MNLSGTINTFRLLYAPRLARPHVVLNHFTELSFPLGKCIAGNVKKRYGIDVPEPDIRAVVIDKDNCIAKPHALEVWPEYKVSLSLDLIVGQVETVVGRIWRGRGVDCEQYLGCRWRGKRSMSCHSANDRHKY
jgi:hypothetical protein